MRKLASTQVTRIISSVSTSKFISPDNQVRFHESLFFPKCTRILFFRSITPSTKTPQLQQQRFRPRTLVRNKSSAPSESCPGADYNVSETILGADACKKLNLTSLGIDGPSTLYHNLTFQELLDHEIANGEGEIAVTKYGKTFTVDTGKFTGRSPKDKWIVLNKGSESEANIDWGSVNQPTTPEVFDELYQKAVNYFSSKEKAYVFDCFCGANPKVRCVALLE